MDKNCKCSIAESSAVSDSQCHVDVFSISDSDSETFYINAYADDTATCLSPLDIMWPVQQLFCLMYYVIVKM